MSRHASTAKCRSEVDPVAAAYLRFLTHDIARKPWRVNPLSATRLAEARKLIEGVMVDDSEIPGDDVRL